MKVLMELFSGLLFMPIVRTIVKYVISDSATRLAQWAYKAQ